MKVYLLYLSKEHLMPHTIKMKQKKVINNDKTILVINALNEALIQNELEESDQNATKAQTREGIWRIVHGAEVFFNTTLSGTECTLRNLVFELDPPAKFLRDEYINFLTQIMKKDDIDSPDIISKEISNHNVLIYEILIRLSTGALSVNMNHEQDGDLLMKVINAFIDNIAMEDTLTMTGFLKNKLSAFTKALVTDHESWMACMQQMITAVKSLHANKTIITNTLDLLEQIRLTTCRQLIAELGFEKDVKTINKARFNDNLVKSTLILLEDELIERTLKNQLKHDEKKGEKPIIEIIKSYSDEERQKIVVSQAVKDGTVSALKNKQTKRENLTRLYDFLKQTNFLLNIASRFDALNVTTGWVAIITGAVKLDGLAKLLSKHASNCIDVLRVDSNALALEGGEGITKGLVELKATTGQSLANIAFNTAAALINIQDAEKLNHLVGYIHGTLNSLIELQDQLPDDIQIIDKVVCKKLMDQISPTQFPGIGNKKIYEANPLQNKKIEYFQQTVLTANNINVIKTLEQSFSPNFELEQLKQDAKRDKLHDENVVKQKLEERIPSGFQLGAAVGQGDCFFDSLAQGLNKLVGKKEFSAKSLRLLCDEYIKNSLNADWVKTAITNNGGNYEQYLARIQFTADEIEKMKQLGGLDLGQAEWGNPHIEGHIICQVLQTNHNLNINLHIVEVYEQAIEGVEIFEQQVNALNAKSIDSLTAEGYEATNVVHLVNYKNHFVPLLNSKKNQTHKSLIQLTEPFQKINAAEKLINIPQENNENIIKNTLNLPSNVKFHVGEKDGNEFFIGMATALNTLQKKQQYTAEQIREICAQYFEKKLTAKDKLKRKKKRNSVQVTDWYREFCNKDISEQDYSNEIRKTSFSGTPLVEGRIFRKTKEINKCIKNIYVVTYNDDQINMVRISEKNNHEILSKPKPQYERGDIIFVDYQNHFYTYTADQPILTTTNNINVATCSSDTDNSLNSSEHSDSGQSILGTDEESSQSQNSMRVIKNTKSKPKRVTDKNKKTFSIVISPPQRSASQPKSSVLNNLSPQELISSKDIQVPSIPMLDRSENSTPNVKRWSFDSTASASSRSDSASTIISGTPKSSIKRWSFDSTTSASSRSESCSSAIEPVLYNNNSTTQRPYQLDKQNRIFKAVAKGNISDVQNTSANQLNKIEKESLFRKAIAEGNPVILKVLMLKPEMKEQQAWFEANHPELYRKIDDLAIEKFVSANNIGKRLNDIIEDYDRNHKPKRKWGNSEKDQKIRADREYATKNLKDLYSESEKTGQYTPYFNKIRALTRKDRNNEVRIKGALYPKLRKELTKFTQGPDSKDYYFLEQIIEDLKPLKKEYQKEDIDQLIEYTKNIEEENKVLNRILGYQKIKK